MKKIARNNFHILVWSPLAALLAGLVSSNWHVSVLWMSVALVIQSFHGNWYHPQQLLTHDIFKALGFGVAWLITCTYLAEDKVPMLTGIFVGVNLYEWSIHSIRHEPKRAAHRAPCVGIGLLMALFNAYLL